MPLDELRSLARTETASAADGYAGAAPPSGDGPWLLAGHRPGLYHAGVWAKQLLVSAMSEERGWTGLDVVVDTDAPDPCCMLPARDRDGRLVRRRACVSVTPACCYADASPPTEEDARAFEASVTGALDTLDAPHLRERARAFAACLEESAREAVSTTEGDRAAEGGSASGAASLAESLTVARRRWEGTPGYGEVAVSRQAGGRAFATLCAELALRAAEARETLNRLTADFRHSHGIRSASHPFPDLHAHGDAVEMPFWVLREGRRGTLWARPRGGEVLIEEGEETLLALGPRIDRAAEELADAGLCIAPKAVALTLYERMFVADGFVHGVGGAHYDQVTEGFARAMWGVELAPFFVVSLTLYPDIGRADPGARPEDALEDVRRHLRDTEHNPDRHLAEVSLAPEARRRAEILAERKRESIRALSAPDADRKRLGARIREINEEVAELLEPVRGSLREREERLEEALDGLQVARDREYPYFLWRADEVLDAVASGRVETA